MDLLMLPLTRDTEKTRVEDVKEREGAGPPVPDKSRLRRCVSGEKTL